MVDGPPEGSVEFQLGFISGQLRELIHGSNTNSTKLDAIGIRVGKLEVTDNKREGAKEIITVILKSPAIGWLVGVITTLYVYLNTKH